MNIIQKGNRRYFSKAIDRDSLPAIGIIGLWLNRFFVFQGVKIKKPKKFSQLIRTPAGWCMATNLPEDKGRRGQFEDRGWEGSI